MSTQFVLLHLADDNGSVCINAEHIAYIEANKQDLYTLYLLAGEKLKAFEFDPKANTKLFDLIKNLGGAEPIPHGKKTIPASKILG